MFVRLPPVHITYAVRLSGSFNAPKWYYVMYRSSTREIAVTLIVESAESTESAPMQLTNY